MGISTFSKPGVKGVIKDDELGQLELMNGPGMQLALHLKGEEFITVAKIVFELHSRHESTPPVEYLDHFGIRSVLHEAVRAIEVYNDDRTAEWVEFGAHPGGGNTRVLRYRVFGRTADLLNSRYKL